MSAYGVSSLRRLGCALLGALNPPLDPFSCAPPCLIAPGGAGQTLLLARGPGIHAAVAFLLRRAGRLEHRVHLPVWVPGLELGWDAGPPGSQCHPTSPGRPTPPTPWRGALLLLRQPELEAASTRRAEPTRSGCSARARRPGGSFLRRVSPQHRLSPPPVPPDAEPSGVQVQHSAAVPHFPSDRWRPRLEDARGTARAVEASSAGRLHGRFPSAPRREVSSGRARKLPSLRYATQ